MKRLTWIIVAAILFGAGGLTLLFPRVMLSPGDLSAGHERLGNDCLACHRMFFGAAGDKCLACHILADIGVVTTQGAPVVSERKIKVPFHLQLSTRECRQCHSDHLGLQAKIALGRFSHDFLAVEARSQCAACHQKPLDRLHRQVASNCQLCHTIKGWRPATFDHDKYFRFDRNHRTECATCHAGGDYTKYTCYGCHEHTPAGIEREHRQEGIRDFQNCVRCHRSGDEHETRRGER